MSRNKFVECVPFEILFKIFAFLSKRDIVFLCVVCRQWTSPALATLYTTIHLKSYLSLTRFHEHTHHSHHHIRSIFLRPASSGLVKTPTVDIAATTLASCTALTSIHVDACSTLSSSSDLEKVISALGRTPLKEVILSNFVLDAGLVTAIARQSLRRLQFTANVVMDIPYDVFIPLAREASQLQILELPAFNVVTDAFLYSVVFELRELQELSLSNCDNVTEGCFVEITERCPRLRSVKLKKATFSDTFVEKLGERSGGLRLIQFKRGRENEKVVWMPGHASPFSDHNKLKILKNKLQTLVWRLDNFTIAVDKHRAIVSLLKQIRHFSISTDLIADTRIDRIIEFARRNNYPDDDPFRVREHCELLLESWDKAGWRKGLEGMKEKNSNG